MNNKRHATKFGAERICGADQNGQNLPIKSIGPICGSVFTVSLRLVLGLGQGLGLGLELG